MSWKHQVNFSPEFLAQLVIRHAIWDYFINVCFFHSTVPNSWQTAWHIWFNLFYWIKLFVKVKTPIQKTNKQTKKLSSLVVSQRLGISEKRNTRPKISKIQRSKYWAKKKKLRFAKLAPVARFGVLKWPRERMGRWGRRTGLSLGRARQAGWAKSLPPPAEAPALLYLVSSSSQRFIGQDLLLQFLQIPAVGQIADRKVRHTPLHFAFPGFRWSKTMDSLTFPAPTANQKCR